MALMKTIVIDGKEINFSTSAALPRLYRNWFHKDVFADIHKLSASENETSLEQTELAENLAWAMAKHADPTVPPIDEWLAQFETFSVYPVLGEIMQLWSEGTKQLSHAKKKTTAAQNAR